MADTSAGAARSHIRSLALIANGAFSITNFRGPLVKAWVDAGIKVYALAPDHDAASRAAIIALGAEPVDISMDRAGIRPWRDISDSLSTIAVLRRLQPDATFAYFIKPVIYGSLAAWFAGVRHRYALIAGLGYVYASPETTQGLKRRALRFAVSLLYRLALRRCDLVFFQNEDDLALFVAEGIVAPARALRVNGTGVDLAGYKPVPVRPGPPTFLLMARLLREKGIGEYAAAARIVRQRAPDARFILLGGLDSNPDGLAQAEIQSWVDEGLIEWRGHVDDVQSWIAASNVYVLPSYYREGVPRSSQEAMAMARPVITTDAPGCRDTVIDGVTGFLVAPRDPHSLADAMLRFVNDPNLAEVMGKASRRLAEERFDVHEVNRRMLEAMDIPAAPGLMSAGRRNPR